MESVERSSPSPWPSPSSPFRPEAAPLDAKAPTNKAILNHAILNHAILDKAILDKAIL